MSEIKSAYLDNACIGKVHNEVAEDAHETINMFQFMKHDPTTFTVDLYDRYKEGRNLIADSLGVSRNTICFIESTSHGLGMIANSLSLKQSDNVLVCDLEFFSTVFCWIRHQKRVGFEVRKVKTSDGLVKVDDFKKAADSHTKAIVVSSVQEINGYRVDIEELSHFAREIGAYLIVDGIQEVGALNANLDNLDIDVYCAGGHKWLRNPFGTGFMYINSNLVEKLEPDFYSYFNAKNPPNGWGEYLESPKRTPFDHFEMEVGASKFETGATLNYVGAFGLIKSFELLNSYGYKNIEKQVLDRRKYLQKGLMDMGVKINGSINEKNLSGICTFNLEDGIQEEKKLMKKYKENRIYCSLRYVSGIGGIRVSPHYYTTFEEIDYLLEITKDFIFG
ncbi:MAG: aminotransferase class V-fold PLP-dependent enzyme [Clostridiaceae bacterium]|nr:aminotransferase class V-fold PLP-dependent enzyme [Clostridiaceae bacterium]